MEDMAKFWNDKRRVTNIKGKGNEAVAPTHLGKQKEGHGLKLNTPQSDRSPLPCSNCEVGGQPEGKPWLAKHCESLWCAA